MLFGSALLVVDRFLYIYGARDRGGHERSVNVTDRARSPELLEDAIAETGAESLRDMGKVMSKVKAAAAGRADMARVSATIKARLAG